MDGDVELLLEKLDKLEERLDRIATLIVNTTHRACANTFWDSDSLSQVRLDIENVE